MRIEMYSNFSYHSLKKKISKCLLCAKDASNIAVMININTEK